MKKFFNRNTLFLFDGGVFFLVGIFVYCFPSASAAAIPSAAGSIPHLEDTRRLLASVYIPLGLFLMLFGTQYVTGKSRNWAAKIRGLTLPLLTGVNVYQVTNGNWNPVSLYPYLGIFFLFALTYLYFGFVRQEV